MTFLGPMRGGAYVTERQEIKALRARLKAWADDPSISFLATPEQARTLVEACGLAIREWHDRTAPSRAWFEATNDRLKAGGPPPLGLHLLMGPTAREKFGNMTRNLQERRIAVFQAVAEKA